MKPSKYACPVKLQAYVSGCEYYFAGNLRRLRLSRSPRLTQGRLAQKLGVSRTTYIGYESGTRIPPAWFICCTANFFQVAVDELVGQEIRKEEIKNANLSSCNSETS